MKMLEAKVILKDINNGQILNKYQTAKIITSIKSNINPDCQPQFLNYTIKGDYVFIPKDDLFILEIKLKHFYHYTLVENPA